MCKTDWWFKQLQLGTKVMKHLTVGESTCERFPFIEQPLLVCWYVEAFGHKFLHCGDLFVFSHLEEQQHGDVVTLHD